MSEVLDVLGPHIEHLTELSDDKDYCVMRGELMPGVFIPLHSHADRETFFVISGEIEAYIGSEWQVFKAGETFDITGNQKHALRNASNEKVTLLIASTVKMGRFFKEAGRPAASVPPGPPAPEAMQHFMGVAISYGYELGTPEENASIGISLG